MFIKIKLEPQSTKASSLLKKISYFSIDDDATIIDLKMKIEEYVNVPTEQQEIRTLINVFQDSCLVREVCDVRGSALMLYAFDDCHELNESQFICFLQVYTNELAAQQKKLEQCSMLSAADNNKNTSSSSTSSVTLIADSDTDSSETDTETFSSKSTASDSESGRSTDNSGSSGGKKRSKHDRKFALQNKKLKVTAMSENKFPETLCNYLNEFPECSKQINSNKENMQDSVNFPNKEVISNDFNLLCNESKTQEPKENQTFSDAKPAEITATKIQSNKITTTSNKEKNINNKHPCYSINPEIRDYLAIICSTNAEAISNGECEELLVWFFDRFREYNSSNHLQFDSKTGISIFEGKLWIACMDLNTFKWISENIIQHPRKSFKIMGLKDSKHLCEVVVPVVSKSKNVLDIFDLLEKQNTDITTLKWSIKSRQPLLPEDKDFNEKAISTFCTNELFCIAMDPESKQILEKLNFKLKYCFWQIKFKFI